MFSAAAPAFERSLQILGVCGVANVLFGLWLVTRRNDLAGWLTLTPLVMLALPCFSLPFASLLASEKSAGNIITFHRMLFAVPLPLAMVAIGARLWPTRGGTIQSAAPPQSNSPVGAPGWLGHMTPLMIPIGLLALVTLSPDSPNFNRFWQAIQITPKDLRLDPYVAVSVPPPYRQAVGDTLLIDTFFGMEVREAFLPSSHRNQFRRVQASPNTSEISSRIERLMDALSNPDSQGVNLTVSHKKIFPDVLIRSASPSTIREKHIIADPNATNLPWISLGGLPPNSYREQGKLILGNSPGTVSHIFSPKMIPVEHGKRYLLSTTIRQTGGEGSNYLAVAWYDRTGQLLVSYEPAPKGAGSPSGWATGKYNYYGLVNQTARAEWTRYSVSFGLGDPVEIPRNAAYLRTGALLNENAAPNASAEFTDVVLWEKPAYRQVHLTAPSFRNLFTPGSQAGWLSGHWPTQYLAAQQIGTEELRSLFLDGPRFPSLVNPASD